MRQADFFVSYTSADRPWAEWIAWQLESEGYRVIVQAWDFTPGRDWVHEMQQATVTAERVVVVLSAAYLESGHGEAEWRVFYAEDPSGEQGRLLPVRVGLVEPPGLLKSRVYVDLADQDAAAARGRCWLRPEVLAVNRSTSRGIRDGGDGRHLSTLSNRGSRVAGRRYSTSRLAIGTSLAVPTY